MIPCAYCDDQIPATTRDHLGGRDDDDQYLRPALWVPSHRGCNAAAFKAWRVAGLARTDRRDRLVVESRRTIIGLRRSAAAKRAVVWPAETLLGLAALLDNLVARIEDRP